MTSEKNLKEKTLKGFFWHFIEYFGQQGIQFVISILIARKLYPSDYGLIGTVAIFITLANTFTDNSFGAGLIQKKEADRRDISSVFYISLLFNTLAFITLYLVSPAISTFYKQPILIEITRLLSLNLLISSFWYIQVIDQIKNLNFKRQAKIKLLAGILSGSVGLAMAYLGFGIVSLIAQLILNNLFLALFFWFSNGWRPKFIIDFQSLRQLFKYGYKLLISSVISSGVESIYTIVIGKTYGQIKLGYFVKANRFQTTASVSVASIFQRVTFPVFSLIQSDDREFLAKYRKIQQGLYFLSFMTMTYLFTTSKPLILFLLTEKWEPTAVYLKILCLAGLLFPVSALQMSALKAKGRSDVVLWVSMVKLIVAIISSVFAIRYNVYVILYSMAAAGLLMCLIGGLFLNRLLKYRLADQIFDGLPFILMSITAWGASFLTMRLVKTTVIQLLMVSAVFFTIFLILTVLSKRQLLKELLQMFKKYIFKTSNQDTFPDV